MLNGKVMVVFISLIIALSGFLGASKNLYALASSAKGGDIKGCLIENNSNKPIVGREMRACELKMTDGKIVGWINKFDTPHAVTDTKGCFDIKGVPVGIYGLLSELALLETGDGKGGIRIVIKKDGDVIDIGKIIVKTDKRIKRTR